MYRAVCTVVRHRRFNFVVAHAPESGVLALRSSASSARARAQGAVSALRARSHGWKWRHVRSALGMASMPHAFEAAAGLPAPLLLSLEGGVDDQCTSSCGVGAQPCFAPYHTDHIAHATPHLVVMLARCRRGFLSVLHIGCLDVAMIASVEPACLRHVLLDFDFRHIYIYICRGSGATLARAVAPCRREGACRCAAGL